MGNISYKEAAFNSRRKKQKKSSERALWGFALIFSLGLAFFLTSSLWMPASYDGVKVTPYFEPVSVGDRSLTIDYWSYCPTSRDMISIVEIDNMALDGIDQYEWTVKTKSGRLKFDILIEEPDFVVFYIKRVPSDWKELSLTMNLSEENYAKSEDFKPIKVYVNDQVVEEVSSINERSKEDYYNLATDAKITFYEKEISELQEEKKEIEGKITVAEGKISDLEKSMDGKTDSEKEKITSDIDTLRREKADLEKVVKTKESDIAEIKIQVEQLKEKNG